MLLRLFEERTSRSGTLIRTGASIANACGWSYDIACGELNLEFSASLELGPVFFGAVLLFCRRGTASAVVRGAHIKILNAYLNGS